MLKKLEEAKSSKKKGSICINKSLCTRSDVVYAFEGTIQKFYFNYSTSRFTWYVDWVLIPSVILCLMMSCTYYRRRFKSNRDKNSSETISSLNFAQRARLYNWDKQ